MAKQYYLGAEADDMVRKLRERMTVAGGWKPTNSQVIRYALELAWTTMPEPAEAMATKESQHGE